MGSITDKIKERYLYEKELLKYTKKAVIDNRLGLFNNDDSLKDLDFRISKEIGLGIFISSLLYKYGVDNSLISYNDMFCNIAHWGIGIGGMSYLIKDMKMNPITAYFMISAITTAGEPIQKITGQGTADMSDALANYAAPLISKPLAEAYDNIKRNIRKSRKQ